MKIKSRKIFAILAITMLLLTLLPATALASPTVTTLGTLTMVQGTGPTALAVNPVITESAAGQITLAGDLVLTAPAGIRFDPVAPAPTATIAAPGAGFVAAAGVVSTVGANLNNTLTFDVTAISTAAGPITLAGIRVIAAAGATVGANDITSNVTAAAPVITVTVTAAPAPTVTTTGTLTMVQGTGPTALAVNPVITEGAAGNITIANDLVLTAPAGITFDPAAPAPTITTSPANFVASAGVVGGGGSTLTFDVTAASIATGPITLGGIRVIAAAGATVGANNITSNVTAAAPVITVTVTAAPPPAPAAYSATASILETNVTSTPVNQNIRFTLSMRNPAGALMPSVVVAPITLQSTMDTLGGAFLTPPATVIAPGALAVRLTGPAREGTTYTGLSTNAASQIEFNLTSAIAGTATVNVFTSDETAVRALVGSATVTFTAAAPTAVTISRRDALGATVDVGREVELRAAVVAGISPASGVTVTFEEQEAGAWRSIGTAVTNVNGFADFKYTRTASSAGAVLNYRARAAGVADASANLAPGIIWAAGGALTITGPANANVARNQALNVDVWVNDAHGNRRGGQAVEFRLTRPTGSAATFVGGTDVITVTTTAVAGDVNFGRARATFTPDILGQYTVRATVAGTGITATTVYTAVEMGAVTRMELRFPRDRFALMTRPATTGPAGTVPQPTVGGSGTFVDLEAWVFDAAGIGRRATAGEVTLASSNPTLAVINPPGTPGDALRAANPAGTGRGLVTITGIHTASGQVATLRIPIVGGAVGILETVTAENLKATVALQLVDLDVNPTFRTTAPAVAAPSVDVHADLAFTVAAPAGVTVARQTSFVGGTGRGSFELTAEKPGEYTITVATAAAPLVSRTFTVEFAAPPAPVVGAQSVTMFIGARGFVQDGAGKTMDVAPFIENQRTFVPVRFLAEAFGATADWVPKDAPVRTVTLTRADVTITINIGSPAITVLRNGVTTTVTADVAAFIRNGRTVLPFRAIAEAFGAEVDYGPKDAAIEWVSFKQ